MWPLCRAAGIILQARPVVLRARGAADLVGYRHSVCGAHTDAQGRCPSVQSIIRSAAAALPSSLSPTPARYSHAHACAMPAWSPPAAEHVRYDWQPRITVGKLGVFHKGEVDIWSSFVKAQHQALLRALCGFASRCRRCSPTESGLSGWGAPTGGRVRLRWDYRPCCGRQVSFQRAQGERQRAGAVCELVHSLCCTTMVAHEPFASLLGRSATEGIPLS